MRLVLVLLAAAAVHFVVGATLVENSTMATLLGGIGGLFVLAAWQVHSER